MDIKALILNRAPSQRSRLVIAFLVSATTASYFLLGFLNPIWMELSSKQLTWLQLGTAVCLAICSSLYLNIHFFKLIKFYEGLCADLQQQSAETAKEVARLAASEALAKQETKSLEAKVRDQWQGKPEPKKYDPFSRLK